jgi:hypothetical protein
MKRGSGSDLNVTFAQADSPSKTVNSNYAATCCCSVKGLEHSGFSWFFHLLRFLFCCQCLINFHKLSTTVLAMDGASQDKKHIVIVGKCP